MDNQERQVSKTQEGKVKDSSKKNILAKLAGGLVWWISGLTGKVKTTTSTPANSQGNQQVSTENTKGEQVPTQEVVVEEEDSVAQDVKKIKSFFSRSTENIKDKISPATSKMATQTSQAVGQTAKRVGLLSLLKVATLILVIVLLVVLGLKLFSFVRNGDGNGGSGSGESTPTQTPVSYQPYVQSIYAKDPGILKLEEDINVLSRELSTAVIRETRLSPPLLDFNVGF